MLNEEQTDFCLQIHFSLFLSFNIDFEMIIVTEHSFENIYALRKVKRYQSGNQNKIRNSKKFRKCNDRNKRDNLKNTACILERIT